MIEIKQINKMYYCCKTLLYCTIKMNDMIYTHTHIHEFEFLIIRTIIMIIIQSIFELQLHGIILKHTFALIILSYAGLHIE